MEIPMKILHIGNEKNVEHYTAKTPFTESAEVVNLPIGLTDAAYAQLAPDAEVIIVDAVTEISEELIKRLPSLRMIHSEGVMKVGHLQISKNVLLQLEDLHKQLMASAKFPYYHQMYFKVLPYVVELRGRGVDNGESELQICLDALYGVMLLRLKRQSVSDKTNAAVKDISVFLGQLSDYYFKDKKESLVFE